MRTHLRNATLLALALALLGAGAYAAPPVVRVHGRVSLPGGSPVRGARLLLDGAREAAAVTDADGLFELTLEPGDATALVVTPFQRTVRASHRGWRLATRQGVTALAIEVRAAVESGGATRVEVRSNDAALAAALAAAYAARDAAPVDARFDLVRQLGAEDRAEPALTALEVVRLARPAPPPPAITPAEPAPVTPADPARPPTGGVSAIPPDWSADTVRLAVPPPTDSAAAPAPAPVRAAPAPATARAAPAPAAPAPAPAAPTPTPEPPRERPESLRLFPSAPEPGRPVAPGAAGPAPAVPDSAALRVAPTGAPAPAAVRAPARAATRPPARMPAPRRGASGPRGRDTQAAAADTAPRPSIRVTVRTDSTLPPGDDLSAAPGAGATLRVAHGVAVPDPSAMGTPPSAPPPGRACECVVKGTVEVRSDQPLRGTLRVVVWLADAPATRDTVALFMGPPRPFDLGRVPCGRHRLVARPLASRLFARVEPKTDVFDCAPDVARPIRVVLEPR